MRRLLALGAVLVTAVAVALVANAGPALADPSPNDWAALRQCEASGDYSINTGNGYYGAYQFKLTTWRSVGGSGLPSDASPAEQDYRALYLYRMQGFSPWICASLAGLKQDSSGGSGVVPTRAQAANMESGRSNYAEPNTQACDVGSSTAPPWGGQTFAKGNTYRDMICFQRQLGHLGYGLQGSGYFGDNTLAALHKFESAKHLPQTNVVDQRTWIAAWGRSGGLKPGVRLTPVPAPKPSKAVTKPTKPTPKPSKPSVTTLDDQVWPGLTAAACHVGAKTAPAWPGESWVAGDMSKNLACWQMQMNHRGYTALHGNGYYGGNTMAAAKSIQNINHLGGSGLIGPQTWKAAWQGKVKG